MNLFQALVARVFGTTLRSRFLKRPYWLLLITLWATAPTAHAESQLLRVQLLRASFTDYSADCVTPEKPEELCVPWSFWHIYEARVSQVIRGTYEKPTIKFAYYQSSRFGFEVFADAFVLLEEFDNSDTKNKLGVNFYASRFDFPGEHVCMPTEILDSLRIADEPFEVIFQSGPKSCVHRSDFDSMPWRSDHEDCSDQPDIDAELKCRKDALVAVTAELESLERSVFERFSDRYSRPPWKRRKATAARALQDSRRSFRQYLKSVCDFESTLSGLIGPEAFTGDPVLQLECRYRMIQERIRLLYQQEFVR